MATTDELLEQLRGDLTDAIETLENIKRVAPKLGGVIDGYILGYLEGWRYESGPGSITDLRDRLTNKEDE